MNCFLFFVIIIISQTRKSSLAGPFRVSCGGTTVLDLKEESGQPDKKVLLTNSAQPPAVTLGRAVAAREADQFIS